MELGQLEEEIVRILLDNDGTRKEDVVDITEENGTIYVMVNRRIGTKREGVVTYERVEQRRLRIMTASEQVEFQNLLKHPMTVAHTYNGANLIKLKKQKNGLGRLLSNLQGNGYSLISVATYHMVSPFDLLVPITATKRDERGSKKNVSRLFTHADNQTSNGHFISHHRYCLDTTPQYIINNS
ncbi:hypothetical protein CMO88_03330 [Candidatus Woesearchaeota archaeon]|nr:hypothetical protein [Candidatus Woesearchaeota archaeon]|tara:strand:+ start:1397 stop:1945 length:549 start_codon:yes stop_codon:yes gene_type:complete